MINDSSNRIRVVQGAPICIASEIDDKGLSLLRKLSDRPPFESDYWALATSWLERAESRLRNLEVCESRSRVVSSPSAIVLGDLHGDLNVLLAARLWRDQKRPEAELVILGDLVDRGPASGSVACVALYWWLKDPCARVTILSGNHDLAVTAVGGSKGFLSSIDPSEFVTWLRAPLRSDLRVRLGAMFTTVIPRLPRWVVLPGGLLAVHGSVPHVDAFEAVSKLADLESLEIPARDLVWLRVAYDSARKRPNRRSLGCEIGIENVATGLDRFEELFRRSAHPISIRGMLRGHDHVPGRQKVGWTSDLRPIITINSMSFTLPEDSLESTIPRPVVAIIDRDSVGDGAVTITLREFELP